MKNDDDDEDREKVGIREKKKIVKMRNEKRIKWKENFILWCNERDKRDEDGERRIWYELKGMWKIY